MDAFTISPCRLDGASESLRQEVREFLQRELVHYSPAERAHSWMAFDSHFSRKMGAKGWIGMTWPKEFGGQARTALERYVVLEEMLAAGAPVAAHWIADRQSGPLLMRYGSERTKREILPKITRGEVYFCIGMSEPDSGSDLASVRTRAEPTADGWRINGSKIWTTFAHESHYMIALLRSSGKAGDRHAGLSQFLIDLSTPGVTVRPIINLAGEEHFNEVVFEDAEIPADCLIGEEGGGWQQVTAELALERSGPERYLSSLQMLIEMLNAADPGDHQLAASLGRLVAEAAVLREMSLGIAGMLARGESPALLASIVKDQGALFEQKLPELAHEYFGPDLADRTRALSTVLSYLVQVAPSFSLRGGTREILRGIIAKGLGLR